MRTVLTIVFPFVVGVLIAPMMIKLLHRLKFGQEVRGEGPQTHLKKQGTPTMGGILFIALFVAYSLAFRLFTFSVTYIIASVLLFSAIGFCDDLLKIRRKNSDGLSSKQKLVLQFAVSAALSFGALGFGTRMVFPFIGIFDAGIWFVPLLAFMYIALTNAVNLTDGVDGLAASVTSVVILLLAVIAAKSGVADVADASSIMLASLLAFLLFNWHPAKVIMGDTGSFALGGFVAAASVALGVPLLIPIFGLIYVVENLSVMIQVAYYKRTRRRIFKMSPIHHHFELSGYSEVRIVLMFSAITAVCCAIAYSAWIFAVQ